MTTKPGDTLPTLESVAGTLSTAEKWGELNISRRTLYNWWADGKVQPLGRASGSLALRWAPEEGDG